MKKKKQKGSTLKSLLYNRTLLENQHYKHVKAIPATLVISIVLMNTTNRLNNVIKDNVYGYNGMSSKVTISYRLTPN